MNSKKKMAIISSTDYVSYPMGGMMSFILDSLPYLKEDFDITLWGVSTETGSPKALNVASESYPLRIFSKVKTKNKLIPNFLLVIFAIWKARKIILKEEYDVLYIHGIPLSYPFFNKGPKIVNHIHGMTNPFTMTSNKLARNNVSVSLYEKYRNWVVKKSDLILLASDKEGHERFSKKFNEKDKIKYLPNFADNQIFTSMDSSAARKHLKVDGNEIILVNTGRVSLQKDPILLVESFIYLKKVLNVDAKLIIIGDGELRGRIEEIVSNEKLHSHIIITGILNRNEINFWLNAADLYVYTSHANGFPISLAEAAMCGLPIVTTDVTGVHDLVINDFSGFLVKQRVPKEIAISIQKAIPQKKIFGNNILDISKNFKPDTVVNKMKSYIISVL